MTVLHTNMPPMPTPPGGETIKQCLVDQLREADKVVIAVGYASLASLKELDRLVDECTDLKEIMLVLGMYRFDGMPEKMYREALKLNRKWKDAGKGEIRIVTPFRYHGKVYCFYKDGIPISCVEGSANLSVLKPDAQTQRQYEVASFFEDRPAVEEYANHVQDIASNRCSANIEALPTMPLIREHNAALDGVELVTRISAQDVDIYKNAQPIVAFDLPLKVPTYGNRLHDERKNYTKSNVNVCYAAPRNARKPRDWYEMQLTVSKEAREKPGYPKKDEPFFVATDDGYWFKAHTTSDNNKQFAAVGDELIMGRWLKGRLAAAGLVAPVDNTQSDVSRMSMITQEMLDEYGASVLTFSKTGHQAQDEDGNLLDVWYLSFDPAEDADTPEEDDK